MNRTTLRTFFCGVIALTLSAWTYSQREEAEPDFTRLIAALELSEEQTEELTGIFAETKEKRKALLEAHGIELRSGESANRRALRKAAPELRQLRKETDEKIESVLSAEQFATFQELRKEGRKKLKEKWKEKRKNS